ncbi:MAG TPA: serine hydrolase domain-containing protein [Puia sp.]|uniref:serine hydrolase domain-containing protein n=1 Tax=Puia sp. TaxID=2045100 RepID=UPI002C01E484|nr:serine hydrolase domain-containing protein [Puia sp.]HVU99508.1 serine hydrolase domain-containing protein [Puia sp.]
MVPSPFLRRVVVCLLLIVVSGRGFSQVSDSLAKRIDRVFSEWDKTNSPGCALAVVKNGKVVYTRGYGMSNMEYSIAITPASIFHVASISKQFTAACIQRLALEGKLSLHDDVRKWVPEVPDFGHPITLANLMHHTSGLRDQWDLQALAGWRDGDLITEDDVLEMLQRQQGLNFRPGDEYLYCNTGYTLLGVVVKRVTGVSLRRYADSVFFQPLGMGSTHFHSDHSEIVPNRTSAYVRDGGRWAISIPVFDTYGATSLFTTVGDLAKWDENFYTAAVGGRAFINAMLEPGTFNNGAVQNYASGVVLGEYKGRRIVEHSGADAGYRANFLRFPEEHFSVIVLANLGDINPASRCRQVADLFLPPVGGRDAVPDVVVDTVRAAKWAGDYFDDVTKARMKVEMVAATLLNSGMLSVNGNLLRAMSDSVFSYNGTEYRFRVLEDSITLVLHSAGMRDRTMGKVKKVAVSLKGLEEYVGTYYSKELDVKYSLIMKDYTLRVKTPRNEAAELMPFIRDVFTGPFLVEVERDKKGKVSGFLVSTGRSRNIRFEKI